MRDSK